MGCGGTKASETEEKKDATAEEKEQLKNFDWEGFYGKMPYNLTADDKQKRVGIWDSNLAFSGKDRVTSAEMEEAMGKYLELPKLIDHKKPVGMAFEHSRKWKADKYGETDALLRKQFRAYLVSLKQYFEYWVMFMTVDTSGDKQIDLEEFKKAIPTLEKWGIKAENPEDLFNQIDTNHGGTITFDEFCVFAISESLKYVEDEDEEAPAS